MKEGKEGTLEGAGEGSRIKKLEQKGKILIRAW